MNKWLRLWSLGDSECFSFTEFTSQHQNRNTTLPRIAILVLLLRNCGLSLCTSWRYTYSYSIEYGYVYKMVQTNWRWCKKCQGLFYAKNQLVPLEEAMTIQVVRAIAWIKTEGQGRTTGGGATNVKDCFSRDARLLAPVLQQEVMIIEAAETIACQAVEQGRAIGGIAGNVKDCFLLEIQIVFVRRMEPMMLHRVETTL